jgi:hypothetical protein
MAVHKGVGHYGTPITLDQAKKAMARRSGINHRSTRYASS